VGNSQGENEKITALLLWMEPEGTRTREKAKTTENNGGIQQECREGSRNRSTWSASLEMPWCLRMWKAITMIN